MEENFNNMENIEIKDEKEIEGNKKVFKFIIIVLFSFIIITLVTVMYFYLSINDSNKENNISDENKEKCDKVRCLKCEKNICLNCRKKYELLNGQCKSIYSFKAIYQTQKDDENIDLINKKFLSIIEEMEIEEEKIKPSYNFTFKIPGNYTIYIRLNISHLEKLDELFFQIKNLISIAFTEEFNISKIRSIRAMFRECNQLQSIDITNFNTENLTDMCYLFYGCSSLTSIDLTNFNTSNLNGMVSSFDRCSSLTSINLTNFDTRKVTHLNYLFNDCSSLTSIDLSNFNTENVIYLEHIFSGCVSLTSLDLSNFTTKKVKYMDYPFSNCRNLTYLDISHFSNNSNSYREFCSFISSKGGTIKVSKYFIENIRKYIPKTWEIILIDE